MGSKNAVDGARAQTLVGVAQLESLIEDHYPRIWRAAFVLTGRHADADDLAQETVVQALLGFRRFQGKSGLDTWLYGILLNQVRRLRRGRKRRERLHDLVRRVTAPLGLARNAAPELDDLDWKASLWRRVADLPERQRNCLVLRYSEGLACEAIATIVGCPIGTVKSRIHHGLAALRASARRERTES